MSVVGGNFEYDIFFSYAWAEDATNDESLRNWTRMIADKISKLVAIRFNVDAKLCPYLDRDVNNRTAVALDSSLQQAVERTAVFVALISPYYKSAYCRKELAWFFGRAGADGGAPAERMCLYLILDHEALEWPEQLCEPSGSRLLYKKFHDDGGQPLDLAAFLNGAPTPRLAGPIEDAALEIGNKIKALKDKQKARADYDSSQRPPDKLIVFLEAEIEDEVRWAERRRDLKEQAASVILPAKAPPMPATALENPGNTYTSCDGMVLLRNRLNDEIGERIKRAYLDRRQIYREGKGMVPWALLDEFDEPPPESEEFDIPRIVTRGEWVHELQHKLLGT